MFGYKFTIINFPNSIFVIAMEGNFQLIDIIAFIGICQGVFLSFTLQRISNNNHKANSVLSKLILIATIMLIGRFLYLRYLNYWVFQWSLIIDSIVFLFGPLNYMYVRRLLFKGNENFKTPGSSWIPFYTLLILSVGFVIIYSPEEYYQLFVDGYLSNLFIIISAIMILFNGFYIVKSIALVRNYKSVEKQYISFNQSPLEYLNAFQLSVSLCFLLWSIGFINETFLDNNIAYLGYDAIWVAIPVFIYVIGYFSLKQPELFRVVLEEKAQEKKARLSPVDSEILIKKLDSLMINEKIFLQNNLTLREVSGILKTSTNNISWLLNNVYKTTFYDFINNYRIREFVKSIDDNKHLNHTILALSMDVGFNSKSTFNKVFKTVMNDTPSNFIKKRTAA